jgi:serine/threonine protein kinase/ankyrin repeat protein
VELIPTLQGLGADVNLYSQHKVGVTPLIIACNKNYPKMVKTLLDCGANPALGRKLDGRTPLHFCAELNYLEPAVVLIEMNPLLIDVADHDGKTPISIALKEKSKTFVQFISSKFPRYESLIRRLDLSTLPKSLIRESQLQHQTPSTNSHSNLILEKAFTAARTGDCEYLRSLLSLPREESQFDVNAQMRNGWTLLMEASAVGRFDVVNLLLSFGVNTEARNKKGQTALHEAVKSGYLRAVRALLDGGACVDAVTRKGLTIEEIAESQGHMTLVAYLVNRRANLTRTVSNTISEDDSTARTSESAQSLPTYFPSSLSSSNSTIPTTISGPPQMERNHTYPSLASDQRDKFNFQSWLVEIGLEQYGIVLEANGFDSIPALEVLTDPDLSEMGFLLGHKRIFLKEYAKLHQSHPFLFLPRQIVLPINTQEEFLQEGEVKRGALTGSEKKKSRRKKRSKINKALNLESTEVWGTKPPRPEIVKKPDVTEQLHRQPMSENDNNFPRTPSDQSFASHYIHADTLLTGNTSDSPFSKDFSDDLFLDAFDEPIRIVTGTPNQQPNVVKELKYEELEVGPIIGEGSFGTVRSGWWRGMHVAIKALRLIDSVCNPCNGSTVQQDEREAVISLRIKELRHEAMTMARVCNHSYVINFIGIITMPIPCVVTSFCSNGSMEDLLFKSSYKCQINNDTLLRFATESAQGIQHLHLEGIIHRDLAARNLLIDENFHVRVADFGFARIKEQSASKGYTQSDMGPVRWSAPEAMRNKKYSEYSDIFSYGVVLYEMFTQHMPWDGYETLDVAIRVCSGERMVIPESVPRDVSDLMILCWSHEAICRPTMNEIIKCLLLMRNQVALLDKNNQEFLWMLHEEEEEVDEEENNVHEVNETGNGSGNNKEWLQKWYFSDSPHLDSGLDGEDDHQRMLNHYHIMTPNISRDNSETNQHPEHTE